MGSVVVITPPGPIVLPDEIPGSSVPDESMLRAMIQAATEEIDGPNGWVGRCFGPQTLEARRDCFPGNAILLPYPPLIEVVSVKYDDPAGVEQTVSNTTWRQLNEGIALSPTGVWPTSNGRSGSVRVRYKAGYDGGEGRGNVPERARQAVVLMVTSMLTGLEKGGGLRSFEATGAFTKQFNSPEMMERVRSTTVERLLQGLRVYA